LYKPLIFVISFWALFALSPSIGFTAPAVTDQIAAPIHKLWDAQTLKNLTDGQFSIPDTFINELLAQRLNDHPDIQEVTVAAKSNNRLEIRVVTPTSKIITLEGTIEEFRHDKERSYLKFKLHKKSLSDRSITSWLFSNLSLGFLTKVFGNIDTPENLHVSIKRNTITVDFHEAMRTRQGDQPTLLGIPLPDVIRIHGAGAIEGAINIRTSLDVSDVGAALIRRTKNL
jgi:hypothetical protein